MTWGKMREGLCHHLQEACQGLTLCLRQGSSSTPAPQGCFGNGEAGWPVGISTLQGGLWPALRPLPQADRKASVGQWGQQHDVPPFAGGVGGVQTTLETPSSSSQSPLDTLIDSGKDRPFHLGPQRRGGTRPPSQDPKKILKSVQSSGLPKGSPISSRQPEWAPPHARGSSQKPEFTRPCTACPPTSSPHPSSLSPSLTLLHPHRPPHCSSNSPGMVLPQGL